MSSIKSSKEVGVLQTGDSIHSSRIYWIISDFLNLERSWWRSPSFLCMAHKFQLFLHFDGHLRNSEQWVELGVVYSCTSTDSLPKDRTIQIGIEGSSREISKKHKLDTGEHFFPIFMQGHIRSQYGEWLRQKDEWLFEGNIRVFFELPKGYPETEMLFRITEETEYTLSQPSNAPASESSEVPARTLPQALSHGNQVLSPDVYILRRYPVMWEGLLSLKNAYAAVQMHFVSGNPSIARASLPPIVDGESQPLRISQRMRLDDPAQLDGVYRKMQLMDEHCILITLPVGKNQKDLMQQSNNLKFEFISYLLNKDAVGIINAASPGTQQPAFVIHIFPSCDFIENNLSRIAPSLLRFVNDNSHLVIIIAKV